MRMCSPQFKKPPLPIPQLDAPACDFKQLSLLQIKRMSLLWGKSEGCFGLRVELARCVAAVHQRERAETTGFTGHCGRKSLE